MPTNEWDYQTKSGTSDFLKVESGETVTLRIVSSTYYRQNASIGNDLVKRSDYPKDEDWQAILDDPDTKVSDRFVWGVWVRKSDQNPGKENKAAIFECGPMVYNAIKKLAQDPEYGDPRGYDLKISREGEKLETKYTVIPGKNTDDTTADEGNAVLELDIEKIVPGSRLLADVVKEMTQ